MADDHPFAKVNPAITRYFDAKGLKPSVNWKDLGFDEHAIAFSVARTAGYDVLGDIRAALSKAIHERQDFDEFRKGLEPLLQEKGWWGRKFDPASGKEVQLGSPRRLRTIYYANVRSAYAAGQWERIERTKDVLPYLVYVMSTAVRKRELHLSWVGTVLPVDDAWWDTHYPPNGWHCQCRVRQISADEAGELDYDPDADAPDDGFTNFVNKVTGEVSRVPNGISPGWAQNPGKRRTQNAAELLAGRLDAMEPEARRIATQDIAGSWLVRAITSGDIPHDLRDRADPANVARGRISAPIASLPEATAKALGAETRVVSLSVADATKIRERHPEMKDDWPTTVQAALDAGVDQVAEGKGKVGMVFGRFRLLLQVVNKGAFVVLKTIHVASANYQKSIRKRGDRK